MSSGASGEEREHGYHLPTPVRSKGQPSNFPAGTYHVDIEEEQIEGLSFLAYRRLATFIRVPVAGHGAGSSESLLVDPKELEQALARDAAADAATGR